MKPARPLVPSLAPPPIPGPILGPILVLGLVLGLLAGCRSSGEPKVDPEQQFQLYKETALAHWDNKDMLRAEGQARKALEIHDDDPQLRLLVGWARLRRGTPTDLLVAENTFSELEDEEHGDYRVWLGLAAVHERLGLAYEEAARDFRNGRRDPIGDVQPAAKASEMDSSSVTRWRDSIAYYQRTLEARPDERKAILGLQRVYAHLGEHRESVRWADRLIESSEAELKYFRAQLRRADLAEREEQRLRDNVRDITDLQIETHMLAAANLFKLHDYAEALDHVEGALQIDPRLADAYAVRAQLLHRLGSHDRAIADIDTFLRLSEAPFDHPDVRRAYELRSECEVSLAAHPQAAAR